MGVNWSFEVGMGGQKRERDLDNFSICVSSLPSLGYIGHLKWVWEGNGGENKLHHF